MKQLKRRAIAFFVLVVLAASVDAAAQTEEVPPDAAAATDLTPQAVKSRAEALKADDNLDPDVKSRAQDLYGKAAEQLKSAAERQAQVAQWAKQRAGLDDRLAELKKELAQVEAQKGPSLPEDASPAELERALADERARRAKAEETLEQVKSERTRRASRRAKMPEIEQQYRNRLDEIAAALAAPSPPGESSAIVAAQQTLRQATKQELEAELKALGEELPTYDVTAGVLDLEEQLAEQTIDQAGANVDRLESELAGRRQQQAQSQARRARIEASMASGELASLANENVRLATLRSGPPQAPQQGLAAKIKALNHRLQLAQAQRQSLEDVQAELDERLQIQGISSLLGPLLFSQKSTLPHTADLRRQMADRQQEIAEVRLSLSDVSRQLRELQSVDDELADVEQSLPTALEEDQRVDLLAAARELLLQRRTLLSDLEDDYTAYYNRLNDLSGQQQKIVSKADALRDTLDRHLLWVQTSAPLGWRQEVASRPALAWLGDRQSWQQVPRDAMAAWRSNPLGVLSPLLALAVLTVLALVGRRRLRHLRAAIAEDALVSYRVTSEALLWTLAAGLVGPTALFAAGWWLYSDLAANDFTRTVGAGLLGAALAMLPLELMRQTVHRGGLAEAHFRWSAGSLRVLRRMLRWFMPAVLPLVFVIVALEWNGDVARRVSLGRLCFVAAMLLTALAAYHEFRQGKQAPQAAAKPRSPLRRLTGWFAALAPLAIALVAIAGYYFTALELARRALETVGLGVVVILLHGMALRWLRLVRGRLALSQMDESRDEPENVTEESAGAPEAGAEPPEPEINLATVNHDTRNLLQGLLALVMLLGLWFIWVDVAPGTYVLGKPLWSTAYEVTHLVENSNGPNTSELVTEFRVVTVADVLLAVLVAISALVAARYIAGLLQVSIPQNAGLDEGARFALITVVRYLLVAFGVIGCFAMLGVGWSRVQWLVAALSVGIGFGLQELVANFISGLIMLFERPVRVGDVVTVDDVTGVVTRIKIRATTIRNWDQQEYFVPNKDLITGRVLNWTLSDKVSRITIPVGVAYSSDPRRVRQTLLDVLARHPNVLADPAPLVTFEQFGDSSLNFVVRAYLAAVSQRLDTINQLHENILERFRDEGIEIPFPQRDLNVRTVDAPVLEKLHR